MPNFTYKAANAAGKVVEVAIEAENQQESLGRLRQRGYTPIKLIGDKSGIEAGGSNRNFWERKELDPCDFTNRLVPLLDAQIPLERALGIVEEGMEREGGKAVVASMRRGLHEGKKFSQLIRDKGNMFPGMYANMVEAGEESGSLPGVLVELQKFLNESRAMREFLITSSIYPAIILSVTLVVIVLLFTVFIPKFAEIFQKMGKELPLPTLIMLRISQIATNFWWLWLFLIAACAAAVRQIRRSDGALSKWHEMVLKFPVIGNLLLTIEMTRFVRTLSVLIQNHVHLLDTVRISEKVIQNRSIVGTLQGVSTELKGGARLSGALAKSGYVPHTVLRMLSIGEETGRMGEMLDKVADQYEESVKTQIKRLLALFEPAVILLLAVVVLMVVLSLFLAIAKMNEI